VRMLDSNEDHKQVLAGVGDIGRISPDIAKSYLTRTNHGLRACRYCTSARRRHMTSRAKNWLFEYIECSFGHPNSTAAMSHTN
jgi:hypothetical protein